MKAISQNNLLSNIIIKHPTLTDTLFSVKKIWYPEWKHLMIVEINEHYFLFENTVMVFHSLSYDVVKMNLIERFYFYKKE